MLPIADMIKQHRERKGYSQEEFARKMNVSQSAVSDWEKGVTTPRPARLQKIASALDINIDILLQSVVGVKRSDDSPFNEPAVNYSNNTRSIQPNIRELYVELPYASVKAQAGMPANYEGCQLTWLSETYPVFLANALSNRDQIVIEIDGESMTPSIRDGANVLADAVAKENIQYESGGIYAVLFGNSRFVVKRIKTNTINSDGFLRLWSDNETYGHIDVPANEIHCMWKVVGKVWEPMK